MLEDFVEFEEYNRKWYDPINSTNPLIDNHRVNVTIAELNNIKIENGKVILKKYSDFTPEESKKYYDTAERLRKYMLFNYDLHKQVMFISTGKNISDVAGTFKKLYKLDVSSSKCKTVNDDVESDDGILNFNKFGSGINLWFPEMWDVGVGGAKNGESVVDSIRDRKWFHHIFRTMTLPEKNRMGLYCMTFPTFLIMRQGFDTEENLTKIADLLIAEMDNQYKEKIKDIHPDRKLELVSARREVYFDFHNWFYESEYVSNSYANKLHDMWSRRLIDDRILPGYFQVIKIGGGNQSVVNFPPVMSKYLYENYIPNAKSQDEIVIMDPCSGWAGRLAGFLAASCSKYHDKKTTYIGTDVNSNTHTYNGRLRFASDPESDRTDPGMIYEFWNKNVYPLTGRVTALKSIQPCQIFSQVYPEYVGKVDMAFTSPPYFDRERYSDDDNQSFKGCSYDDWVETFLKPFCGEAWKMLKDDTYFLVNIADLLIGKSKKGHTYLPLEADTIRLAEECGFKYIETHKMILSKGIGNNPDKLPDRKMKNKVYVEGYGVCKYEPVLIFKKG